MAAWLVPQDQAAVDVEHDSLGLGQLLVQAGPRGVLGCRGDHVVPPGVSWGVLVRRRDTRCPSRSTSSERHFGSSRAASTKSVAVRIPAVGLGLHVGAGPAASIRSTWSAGSTVRSRTWSSGTVRPSELVTPALT